MGHRKTSFVLNIFLGVLLLASFSSKAKAVRDDPEEQDQSGFSYIRDAWNGPDNWGRINTSWVKCKTGRFQSPINIITALVSPLYPYYGDLIRKYKSGPAVIKNRGHDIEIEWTEKAGGIQINYTSYDLVQAHWHIPGEHKIDGITYDMELHLVHTNYMNKIAVVGILYRIGDKRDPLIDRIEPFLPLADREGVEVGDVDARVVNFPRTGYYRYNGSLTTPPCTQNVTWSVYRTNSVTKDQIDALKLAVHDLEDDHGNARPIQRSRLRKVEYHESLFPVLPIPAPPLPKPPQPNLPIPAPPLPKLLPTP